MSNEAKVPSENRDPITGAPGAHPVGVGVGAAAGGVAAGAAAGTVAAGPIGTVIGAAIGAIAGGLAGKAVAEHYDPTVESAYWRENHASQTFRREGTEFSDYEPAYKVGYEGRNRYGDRSFDDALPDLQSDYETARGGSRLDWNDAEPATRAAWGRRDAA